MSTLEINGTEPPVVGLICQDLIAVEFQHAGEVVEPANVIFLRFDDQWHRLHFDFGVVFWRQDTNGPSSFVADELDAADFGSSRTLGSNHRGHLDQVIADSRIDMVDTKIGSSRTPRSASRTPYM